MSGEVRHELNTLLVDQIDAFARVIEERDQALGRAEVAETELAALCEQHTAEVRTTELGCPHCVAAVQKRHKCRHRVVQS